MPSKYCATCDDIESTMGFVPNYCGRCGKDLRNEPLFPEFSTYKERVELLTKLRAGINIYSKEPVINTETGQLSLF